MRANRQLTEHIHEGAQGLVATAIGAPKVPSVRWDDVGGLLEVPPPPLSLSLSLRMETEGRGSGQSNMGILSGTVRANEGSEGGRGGGGWPWVISLHLSLAATLRV